MTVLLAALLLLETSAAVADDHSDSAEALPFQNFLDTAEGTSWAGPAELWIDPTGNQALHSDAAMTINGDGFSYTWSYEGQAQEGQLQLLVDRVQWRDSWHQPEFVELMATDDQRSLLAMAYSYPAGSGPDWGWRIQVSQRPDSSLVLAMTNIAPWGEEVRAVRMVMSSTDNLLRK
ncbi:MAG: hypothetical protein AAGJ52_12630 [Pseudomonadota bacterium]